MAQTLSSPAVRIGSMEIFWTLIEPILATFPAKRICEIGVAEGVFTSRLLAWGRQHGCAYVGIDPKMNPAAAGPVSGIERAGDCEMLNDYSLAVLPALDRCDAYFLDGDHNFFTVRNELALISSAARGVGDSRPSPIVFVHDVGWPWGRRDMYYLPSVVPAGARQIWSETLGVSLERDELVDGGLREPGRYAISVSAGGPRNGVLTAVEDFLEGPEGKDWAAIILPIAYGLAILYQPAQPSLSAACRGRLEAVQKMAATGAGFFEVCEQNYLRLYLYSEYSEQLATIASQDLQREGAAHRATLAAYDDLHRAYGGLLAHSHALGDEYQRLLAAYGRLRQEAAEPLGLSSSQSTPVDSTGG